MNKQMEAEEEFIRHYVNWRREAIPAPILPLIKKFVFAQEFLPVLRLSA